MPSEPSKPIVFFPPPLRDRVLWAAMLVSFVLWISCVGPVRTWALDAGVRGHWAVGVAPSFFAAMTFVCVQAIFTHTSALYSAELAIGLTLLAEAAHLVLPASTADWGDVLAGVAGALVMVPLVAWRLRCEPAAA